MSARRAASSVLLILLTTGCATSFELKNPMPRRDLADAQLASAEAVGDYPKDAQPKDLALTAVIDRDAKSLDVINPTDVSYHGVRIWLNQQHVAWVNELPSRRVVHVPQALFADADKNSLSLATANVRTMEMQANGDLYHLFGPAMEPSQLDQSKPTHGLKFAIPPPGGGGGNGKK